MEPANYLLLFGPNLNRLGQRDPSLYGTLTLAEIGDRVRSYFEADGLTIDVAQSNSEGRLIDFLQDASDRMQGVVFNPGAFAHYSYALRDAIADCRCPVVEVHFSNTHAREEFRHTSVTAAACKGVVAGLGWFGLVLAIMALREGQGTSSDLSKG